MKTRLMAPCAFGALTLLAGVAAAFATPGVQGSTLALASETTSSSLGQTYASDAAKPGDADRQTYEIYVDKEGVMRRSDTKAEVAYFGTNYTLPFAHAFRATAGMDRKSVIDMDVRQFKRLGLNGFRLHLWEAEIADSAGNLIDNEHLDLLDYLIASLEKEGIDIVITAQTNFGNGYPEKNIDTGAYTYDFDKCDIHENPAAQKAQERYLTQLVRHINPYNGRSYASDKAIIAIEINNEPCHSGTRRQVTAYINRMAKALRKAGFDRMVLYNVSHNPEVTAAYYDANIQGTTYQWYPDGLVAGHLRKSNYLPTVDNYDIPWKNTMKNYNRLARFVYEFDPGDVLFTHLYPAIARTFRKEGFQWATQFAYDPTPIAPFNTEYQTHYVNLLYTPSKAMSLAVAAEAMREVPRGADYSGFPKDTVFGDFTVSYRRDLAILNSPERFIHTRTVDTAPVAPERLLEISGVGSSPMVDYSGSGAYFLTRVNRPGNTPAWRLEVMPDATLYSDPFRKPSLKKQVAGIYYRDNSITLRLPGLSKEFDIFAVESHASRNPATVEGVGKASDGSWTVAPGVYLLGDGLTRTEALSIVSGDPSSYIFAAPRELTGTGAGHPFLVHKSHVNASASDTLHIEAEWMGATVPDSVVLYPSTVSFWRENNPTVKLRRETTPQGAPTYRYTAEIPASMTGRQLRYNLVAFTSDGPLTYPAGIEGTPLSWDAPEAEYYTVPISTAADPVTLLRPVADDPHLDISSVPEDWTLRIDFEQRAPIAADAYHIDSNVGDSTVLILRRYVAEDIAGHPGLAGATRLVVALRNADSKKSSEIPQELEIALTTLDGTTWKAPFASGKSVGDGRYEFDLSAFVPTEAYVVPAPFPTFLPRRLPETTPSAPLTPAALENVELRVYGRADLLLEGVWLKR